MIYYLNNLNKSRNKGFSLIEIMVVMGLSAALFGFMVFNLVRFQGSSSQQSNTDSLISDIKNQQFKAMIGGTEGRADSDNYGVYFYSDRYVLFHGVNFDPVDPDNFTVDLPEDLEIQSISLPNNTILFTKLSGDISSYSQGSDSFTVRALNINRDFVITLNRYGVITGIN